MAALAKVLAADEEMMQCGMWQMRKARPVRSWYHFLREHPRVPCALRQLMRFPLLLWSCPHTSLARRNCQIPSLHCHLPTFVGRGRVHRRLLLRNRRTSRKTTGIRSGATLDVRETVAKSLLGREKGGEWQYIRRGKRQNQEMVELELRSSGVKGPGPALRRADPRCISKASNDANHHRG